MEVMTCGIYCNACERVTELIPFSSRSLKLLEQIKVLQQTMSQQSGERRELISQLDKVTIDHTSANQNTESMVGKIQVKAFLKKKFPFYLVTCRAYTNKPSDDSDAL